MKRYLFFACLFISLYLLFPGTINTSFAAPNDTPKVSGAYTGEDGSTIEVVFDQVLNQAIPLNQEDFRVYANTTKLTIDAIDYHSDKSILITIDGSFFADDWLKLIVDASAVTSVAGEDNPYIDEMTIENRVTPYTVTMVVYHNDVAIPSDDLIFFEHELGGVSANIDIALTVTDKSGQAVNNLPIEIHRNVSGNFVPVLIQNTDVNGAARFNDVEMDSTSNFSTNYQFLRMNNVSEQAMYLVPANYTALELSFTNRSFQIHSDVLDEQGLVNQSYVYDFMSTGRTQYYVLKPESSKMNFLFTDFLSEFNKFTYYEQPLTLIPGQMNEITIDNMSFRSPDGFTVLEKEVMTIDEEINTIDNIHVINVDNVDESFKFSPMAQPMKKLEFWISDGSAYSQMNIVLEGTLTVGTEKASFVNYVSHIAKGSTHPIHFGEKRKIYEDALYSGDFGDFALNYLRVQFTDHSNEAAQGSIQVSLYPDYYPDLFDPDYSRALYEWTSDSSTVESRPYESNYIFYASHNANYYYYYFNKPWSNSSELPIIFSGGGEMAIKAAKPKVLTGDIQQFYLESEDGSRLSQILNVSAGNAKELVQIRIRKDEQEIEVIDGQSWMLSDHLQEGLYTAEITNAYGYPIITPATVTFAVYHPIEIESLSTNMEGNEIYLKFNQQLRDESVDPTTIQLNGTSAGINQVIRDSQDETIYKLILSETVLPTDQITVNIPADIIYSVTGFAYAGATELDVNSNVHPTYSIDPISDQTFNSLNVGYTADLQEIKTITVNRSGTGELVNLKTSLSGTNANDFIISQPLLTTLNDQHPTTTFTVKAREGLPAGTYIAVVTINAANMTDIHFTVRQVVHATTDDDDDDDGGSFSEPTTSFESKPDAPEPTNAAMNVLVNGKEEKAGIVTVEEVNGRQVISVLVDEDALRQRLEEEGEGAVITIPVTSGSDVVIGELNGRLVKYMENMNAVVKVVNGQATYSLPAKQIDIDAVSDKINADVELQDIRVKIQIDTPSGETVSVVESAVNSSGLTLIAPPITFAVSVQYGNRVEEVNRFNAYVERTIAIPQGVNPNQVTTGVVVEPDGTIRHVPTQVINVGGRYYAQINSLTNSTYAIVWNPLEYEDASGHWAEDAVNDMGSRLVVSGNDTGMFIPDEKITRGEFTAIVVGGLGLLQESGKSMFSDDEKNEYAEAIHTAYNYRLISGFDDGTFRPNEKITREQAMVIISNAMSITGLREKMRNQSESALHPFRDASDISDWALSSMANNVQAGIISGKSGNELGPKDFITRAEAAVMIKRLLRESDLI